MRLFFPLRILLLFVLLIAGDKLFSQCSSYPVPLEQRVSKSAYIVQGKVIEKHAYIDAATGGINTLNKFRVAAWLKNYSSIQDIYVITLGGVYGNRAMQVNPALQLDMQHEYLLMLEEDNAAIDDKNFRQQNPQALQLLTYADAQGSLTNENNFYHDLYYRTPKPEQTVFEEISRLTNQLAKKPSGELFVPRPVVKTTVNSGIAAVSGFTPTTANAGTIVVADQITITGSGFGAIAGNVFFRNADDGGATFTASGVATDVLFWDDATIVVKPAAGAGTGQIAVGAFVSGSILTIPYAHIAINDDFSGFPGITRQRYYLRNQNTIGGYTYTYNTAFEANTPAKQAFERALLLWRCNTFINWRTDATTTSAVTSAIVDGVNIVTFGTLPVGVLGRATSYFSGSAITPACDLDDTVWWLTELDIVFTPDPPAVGFTWQYGPLTPSGTQYDFESVALHELGHHHGLKHVINTLDVMNFSLSNGSTRRVLSTDNINGGNAKVSYSTTATCFNPAGSGTPMIGLVPGNCTLPVDLTEFKGERKTASTNRLAWFTAHEFNNYGFYLQRSADGISFNEITFIKSAGNNNQSTAYEFMDTKAGLRGWYYRLRQVDIDAREKISKTIFIDGDKNTDAKIWASETGDKVFVYIKTGGNNNAILKLMNAQGQQALLKQITNSSTETGVAHLPKGVYYYQLHLDGRIISGKLLLGAP